MLMIPVDFTSAKPIYLQIADHVTTVARNGQLAVGTRLPASRNLAEQLQVHRSTVVNAYEELKARGIIESQMGSGSYIATNVKSIALQRPQSAAPRFDNPDALLADLWKYNRVEDVISLAMGLPADELIPVDELESVRARVLRRDGPQVLNYEEPQGYYPLRHAIAQDLARHGMVVSAEEIIITMGAQEGVSLAARTFASAGDSALMEAPTFFYNLFNIVKLCINPIPFNIGSTGPDWANLHETLQTLPARPRFVAVSPDHHNPSGVQWSMPDRHDFLRLMTELDIPVVEDATYLDLNYDGTPHLPLRALDPQTVYIGSFSKSLMPGLRLGYMIGKGRLNDHLLTLKMVTSGSNDALSQRTLAEYLNSGRYQEHLERINRIYRRRRDAMIEALKKYMPREAQWHPPAGGFYVWVTLPNTVSVEKVFRQALQKGVLIAPARVFYSQDTNVSAFRLAFARYPEEVLTHAVKVLGGIINRLV
jgi:DNA-binding transcriptional MocR family regulator